jgi:hypothetical protein
MATTALQKTALADRSAKKEGFFVEIPQKDKSVFKLFAKRMGWQFESRKQALWNDYIETSPENLPLTDEDIIEAVKKLRYGKV